MSNVERIAWIVGVLGLLASIGGWLLAPQEFPHAWLAAVTCFSAWPLGSLALVLIHALTGGRWGLDIRPQLAVGIATLPLLLPALLPLLFVEHALYPWMNAAIAAHLKNRFYLNGLFFYLRWVFYLAVWLGLSLRVLRVLGRADAAAALYRMAPLGLISLGLTVSFAAIDSTLSLEPQFKSSIYGMLACAEAVLFALSIALMARVRAGGLEDPSGTRDLGRLLFALLVLWAYLDFMQILIIWNSDLPDEAGWYLQRLAGEWRDVALAIAVLHFLLPFFALIWPQVQRSRAGLGGCAALLVLTEIPRAWWIVIPAARRNIDWLDAAAMAAMLGLAAGWALRAFGRRRRSAGVPAYG